MSIALKDFVKIMMYDNENVRIFDNEDNVIFKGTKKKLIELLLLRQTLAIKKITTFYVVNDIVYINVK